MQAERAAVFAWKRGKHRELHPLSGYAFSAEAAWPSIWQTGCLEGKANAYGQQNQPWV